MATNEVKKRLKKRIIFSALFVSSMLMIMISVTFSWFHQVESATMSDITIDAREANNLLVKASDADVWSKVVKMSFADDFEMQGVSGDGIRFFEPVIGKKEGMNDSSLVGYKQITEDLAKSGIYEFEFSCFVENSLPLYLDSSSALLPSAKSPESAYGSFSAGHICAAMRVAILQKVDGEYVLKCIWIPNATTELTTVGEISVGEGDVESEYVFISDESATEKVTVQTAQEPSGQIEIDGVLYAWGDLDDSLEIGRIEGNAENDFKLVIWIDGNDRESHNALLDGLVSVQMKFYVGEDETKGE